jgi:hypothetical protein
MRDRNLERNIKRVEAFIERWKQFNQFLQRGFQGHDIAGEEEVAFLDLKSAIAQEHEVLAVTLASSDRDDRALRLLNLVPSLRACKDLPEETARKVATEWHNTFLALQALLGRLKGRQAQLAGISSLRIGVRNVFGNPLVILLVLAASAYGVYKFADEWIPKLKHLMESKP